MTIDKTLSMQRRAEKRIPGVTQLLSKRPDRFVDGIWPAYYSKAKGACVWDLDGNEYLDMSIGGIGATVLGYADEEVDGSVVQAIQNGVASSLNCPEEVELAELLCELHPWADMARFTRSGGEAMAVAVRIARAYTGRDVVAFCGYHGWHDWYLAANVGGQDALNGHLMHGLEPVGVPQGLAGSSFPFRFNRLDELQRIVDEHGENLAAIVMEPLRNEEPSPEFIQGVRHLADKTQAVLIMDEISAGLRYNTGGAHLVKHATTPDIAVFSKALGNGYAIAAIVGRKKCMSAATKTFISSTNWTERVGFVAGLATLRKHRRENVGQHLVALGARVQRGWMDAANEHGLKVTVSGMEPMSSLYIEAEDSAAIHAYFAQLMIERGILASKSCYLMHSHTEGDVDRYLLACSESFSLIAQAIDKGNVRELLRGAPCMAGFKRLS